MQLREITVAEANDLLARAGDGHYLGRAEYLPSHIVATEECDAIAVFAPPTASHFKIKLPGCLECTRLWQSQERRERGEHLSKFLKASCEFIRSAEPECPAIFSYSDPSQHNPATSRWHNGFVYLAARFKKFGDSRVTDYWRDWDGEVVSSPKMYRRHKTKSRDKLRALGYELIEKPPKALFVYGLALHWREVVNRIGGRYAKVA